jgi:uncharacterized HAD superfamily protein
MGELPMRNGVCYTCLELANSTDPIPFEPVKPRRIKIYQIDIDGTLCEEVCWTVDDVENATPNKELIKWVNEKFETDNVQIYTARKYGLARATLDWLDANGIRYHGIKFSKPPADVIVDADALRPEELYGA